MRHLIQKVMQFITSIFFIAGFLLPGISISVAASATDVNRYLELARPIEAAGFDDTKSFLWYLPMILLGGAIFGVWVFLLVYAIVKKFRITFITNHGSMIEPVKYKGNEKIILPENPIRPGNTFCGWYLDEAFEKPFALLQMPKYNIKLYAKWQANGNDENN